MRPIGRAKNKNQEVEKCRYVTFAYMALLHSPIRLMLYGNDPADHSIATYHDVQIIRTIRQIRNIHTDLSRIGSSVSGTHDSIIIIK